MTYFYLPPTSLKYIDAKPLEARYLALITLIKTYIDIGRHRKMERASYRMARTVKAYIKVLTHNDLLTRKLDMLASPCLLYTSPSPRDATLSRMPSSA